MDLETFFKQKQKRMDKATMKLTNALTAASKAFEEASLEANKVFSDFLTQIEQEQFDLVNAIGSDSEEV